MSTFERLGLPFAPVRTPGELADDPHLNESGGLIDVALPTGRRAKTPLLPITLNGKRIAPRRDPPEVGADTRDVLEGLQLGSAEIERLFADGVVGGEPKRPAAEERELSRPLNTWA